MADVPRDFHRHDCDRWVKCRCGSKHWGANGAAGLLLFRRREEHIDVLLQHRADFSHHGGTWGLPGGALTGGEDAIDGALRESAEEALISPHGVRVWATFEMRHPDWSYTTVIGEDIIGMEGGIGDGESLDIRWVPAGSVAHLPLLPAFDDAWPTLRAYMKPIELVVDVANVVGSTPNGWWRDRLGATERFLEKLSAQRDLDATAFIPELCRIWPHITAVVEGEARAAADRPAEGESPVRVAAAAGAGDEEILAQAKQAAARGSLVIAVTSDRALAERLAPFTLKVAGSATLALNRA